MTRISALLATIGPAIGLAAIILLLLSSPSYNFRSEELIGLLIFEYKVYVGLAIFLTFFGWWVVGALRSMLVLVLRNALFLNIQLARRAFLRASFTANTILLSAVLVSIFASSLAHLSYVAYRDFKYLKADAVRQSLIRAANEYEEKDQYSEAIRVHEKLLSLFPSDERNYLIKKKIKILKWRIGVSKHFMDLARRLSERQDSASEYLLVSAARKLWPENRLARDWLKDAETKIRENATKYKELLRLCKTKQFSAVASYIDQHAFMLDKQLTQTARAGGAAQFCFSKTISGFLAEVSDS